MSAPAMSREAFVNGLKADYGTSPENAERAADRVYGRLDGLLDAMVRIKDEWDALPTLRTILAEERGHDEKWVEHACDKLVLACGGRVVRFSHPGPTHQTPGISDRLYTFPRLRLHTWFEVKAPDGEQRPDQRLFEEDVTAGGMVYTLGGLGDLRNWLVAHGVVTGFNSDGTPILPPRATDP